MLVSGFPKLLGVSLIIMQGFSFANAFPNKVLSSQELSSAATASFGTETSLTSSNLFRDASPTSLNVEKNLQTFQYTCPSYSASNTNSATQNYVECTFQLCPDSTYEISLCASDGSGTCSGDTYLSLYDSNGLFVTSSDDECGSCSYIEYGFTGGNCQTFSLHEGCFSSGSCSGQVVVNELVTIVPPTPEPTQLPSMSYFILNSSDPYNSCETPYKTEVYKLYTCFNESTSGFSFFLYPEYYSSGNYVEVNYRVFYELNCQGNSYTGYYGVDGYTLPCASSTGLTASFVSEFTPDSQIAI